MKKRRMNRPADQRKAALRALTTNLLRSKKISTTLANAKAAAPEIEKMIGLAKRGDLHARRQAAAFIYDNDVVQDLFTTVADRYQERTSGYTRIIKAGRRRGDNSQLAILELV
jgi:large subunit ribosomal protein L17